MGRCSFFKLKYVMQCCVYVHLLAVNGSVMLISFPVFFFVHSIAVAVVIVVGSFIQLFCVAKRNLIKLFIIFVCLAFIIVYQLCIPSQSGCNANNKSTREPTKEKKTATIIVLRTLHQCIGGHSFTKNAAATAVLTASVAKC